MSLLARPSHPVRQVRLSGSSEWGKEGLECSMGRQRGRMGEREARKNIISTQHGGSHSLYPPTDIMCGLFDRSSWPLWVRLQCTPTISSAEPLISTCIEGNISSRVLTRVSCRWWHISRFPLSIHSSRGRCVAC